MQRERLLRGHAGEFAGLPDAGHHDVVRERDGAASGGFRQPERDPPTPNNQTVNLGEGSGGSVTLSQAGSYRSDPNRFTLANSSPQGSLTFSLGANGLVTMSNTATSPEIDHILFNACDTLSGAHGGPVCSTTPGNITVNIGTPPVTQPFSEQVNAGALVLGCDSPANSSHAGWSEPAAPAPTGSDPLLTVPRVPVPVHHS